MMAILRDENLDSVLFVPYFFLYLHHGRFSRFLIVCSSLSYYDLEKITFAIIDLDIRVRFLNI